MYERLFESSSEVALLAVALACLVATVNGRVRLGLGVMAFGFPSAFAAAFYLDGLLHPGSTSRIDMAACLAFESIVLMLYCRIFFSLRRQVASLTKRETSRVTTVVLLVQLALAAQLLSTGGFGLLSEGSRIEFLFAGASAKFITYGSVLLAGFQGALLASRITSGGRFQTIDYATVLLAATMSVLSGSKGAFFLWLFSALSLVNYRKARISKGLIVKSALVLVATLLLTAHFVGDFLGLEAGEFASLALSRFFLNNDARALAFDFQGQASTSTTLLAESFRAGIGLFVHPPLNPPLGQLLYELNFGGVSEVGANTSAMALAVFYSNRGETLVPVLGASMLALLLYWLVVAFRKVERRPVVRLAIAAWGATALQLFTQDFLAFQLVLPLSVLGVFVLRLIERRHPSARRATERSSIESAQQTGAIAP